MLAERLGCTGDHRRVEGGSDGQPFSGYLLGLEPGLELLHVLGAPGDDDLLGAVVIRDHYVEAGLVKESLDGLDREVEGEHGPGDLGGLRHELPALTCELEQVCGADAARRAQGGQLAEAMTGDGVCLHAQLVDQGQVREAGDPDGGLGPAGVLESLLLSRAGLVVKGADGEDHPMKRGLLVEGVVGGLIPRCSS